MDKLEAVAIEECSTCNGNGQLSDRADSLYICPSCEGSGYVLIENTGCYLGPAKVRPLVVCKRPASF